MKYILINRIKVQNANAISGFTWGFPAITHFLGFTHNLSLKMLKSHFGNNIKLKGCAVVSHECQVHTYGSPYNIQFTQSRNPPYMHGLGKDKKAETAPVIEEGKMNMTVSLLIGCDGNIGNQKERFLEWLEKQCKLQRLAGGTILAIESLDIIDDSHEGLQQIKFRCLPGFMLMDRSDALAQRHGVLTAENDKAEMLNAWLDFAALKQKARPKSDLIGKHLNGVVKNEPENAALVRLLTEWGKHLETPYDETRIPQEINQYFADLLNDQKNEKLLSQWHDYCNPTEKINADWEYISKPAKGYLVPIMVGYKAITREYKKCEIQNTRDNETAVYFVEAVHSVGEWKSVHRLQEPDDLSNCLWDYHHEEKWYLCRQPKINEQEQNEDTFTTEVAEEFFEEDFN